MIINVRPERLIQFLLILLTFLSSYTADNRLEASTYPSELISSLETGIKDKDESEVIVLLQRLGAIPDKFQNSLLNWATDNTAGIDLRRFMLRHFQKAVPVANEKDSEELEEGLREVLIRLLDVEFEYLKKELHPQTKQIKSIIFALQLVKLAKLKKLFYAVIAYLRYPLIDVRKTAFKTMASLNDDRMYPVIFKMLASEKAIERTYAIDALFYIKDERTVSILIKALKDDNKSVRYYAIKALEKLKRTEAIPYFVRMVRSDLDNEVRIKAIQVLSDFRPRSAFSALTSAIFDKDREVRSATLEALLKYKSKNACHYISQQLTKESEQDLKLRELKALFFLGNTGGMQGIKAMIENEKEIHIKTWAIYIAGKFRDYRGFSSILKVLDHKVPQVRVEAIYALARYKDKKAISALINILKNKTEIYDVQAASVYALEKINYHRTLPEVFDLSEDHPNPYIRLQLKSLVRSMLRSRYN